ncbi:MAG: hypothetical protein GKR98_05905 [Boseongicola sp.]|nr:MAG: hypothetical protein GKR98_05905 [Boseongicola sp.]
MNAVTLLIQIVLKTILLSVPFATAWLSFRRLALSRSANGWLYAASGLFAAFTTAGLAPWAFGFAPFNWLFIVFALICPVLWLGIVVVCGLDRTFEYDARVAEDDEVIDEPVLSFRSAHAPKPPLILEKPEWPDAPKLLFRHGGHKANAANDQNTPSAIDYRGVLAVARDMRGRENSENRRLRPLLPPPDAMSDLKDLPFLRPSRS